MPQLKQAQIRWTGETVLDSQLIVINLRSVSRDLDVSRLRSMENARDLHCMKRRGNHLSVVLESHSRIREVDETAYMITNWLKKLTTAGSQHTSKANDESLAIYLCFEDVVPRFDDIEER